LAVGRDHIAATVNTLFLAYAGASLPLLVLFTTGGDSFTNVVTSEAAAVEVVRTLCGSVGLIAAVPLTTLLAAALAPQGADAADHRLDRGTGQPVGPAGRVPYSPARGLAWAESSLVFERVLAVHAPRLSHATSGIGGSLPLDELPPDARQAALKLKRMATTARRSGGSWYRKALAAGTVSLDLQDPGQLDLLRRFGPYSINARVWVEDDPEPVIESAETFDGPRVTYRLEASEIDRLRVALEDAGLAAATVVPRRSRVRVGH